MSSIAICESSGASTCFFSSSQTIAYGYQCIDSTCSQCPPGYYSDDAITCQQCDLGFSSIAGSRGCGSSFNFLSAGLQPLYIPVGVTKINVRLWGGGGVGGRSGLDKSPGSSGGGGGFSSCNISVPMDSSIYVLVAGGGQSKANNEIAFSGGKPGCCQLLDNFKEHLMNQRMKKHSLVTVESSSATLRELVIVMLC